MRVLIGLLLVAYALCTVHPCAELDSDTHAASPIFVASSGKFLTVGAGAFAATHLQVAFHVDCAFESQIAGILGAASGSVTITASRTWTMSGVAAANVVKTDYAVTDDGYLLPGGAHPTARRARGKVLISGSWADIMTEIGAGSGTTTAVGATREEKTVYVFQVDFTGETDHLGRYDSAGAWESAQLGTGALSRTTSEIYRIQVIFKTTVVVTAEVIFVYSTVEVQYILYSTRSYLTSIGFSNSNIVTTTNPTGMTQAMRVEMQVMTTVRAPFKILGHTTNMAEAAASQPHYWKVMTLTETSPTINRNFVVGTTTTLHSGMQVSESAGCHGPYATVQPTRPSCPTGTAGCPAVHTITGGATPVYCKQIWWFATDLQIMGTTTGDTVAENTLNQDCQIDDATLTFSQDHGGIGCGSEEDSALDSGYQSASATNMYKDPTYTCPIAVVALGVTSTTTIDDFTASLKITTSNACASMTLVTDACAAIEVNNADTWTHAPATPGFNVNDNFSIAVYAGVKDTTSGNSVANNLAVQSFTVVVTTSGTSCTGSCNTSYTNSDFTNAQASTCTGAQRNSLSASTPIADLTADQIAQSSGADHNASGYDCRKRITRNFNDAQFNLDNSVSGAETESIITFSALVTVVINDGIATRKRTIDVATKKSDFYSLLQQEDVVGETQVGAETALGAAPRAEVVEEEVQTAPETGAAQEELLIAEETSSNLVYIVVGVLLALSVAIAAVVMYMRRVKGSKKTQPVVPVPITIETQGSSTTA